MEVTAGGKAIGYVRVSGGSGGGGDSFLSPQLHRGSIERVCQREGWSWWRSRRS